MTASPVETECRTPVVDHQRYAVGDVELFKQSLEEMTVFYQAVGAFSAIGELLGIPHPDQVRSQAASEMPDLGDDVAP
jgi:hypothetical protein